MFAPSINLDLEKLQKESEDAPTAKKKVAAKGRAATRKPAPGKTEKSK
jgi:hypothetical protein